MLNVKCTPNNFDQFINKLGNLKNGGLIEPGFQAFVNEARQIAIDGTPIGDERDEHRGEMKQSWNEPVYDSSSSTLKATITNRADYGMASNYGHYQHPGTYVPSIGVRLRHNYIPGTYALETSMQKAEMNFESIIKPEILAVWNDYHYSIDSWGVEYYTTRQSYYDRPGDELI